MGKILDLSGYRFGKLEVIKYSYIRNSHAHWLCRCECGIEKVIDGSNLRKGHTRSCGCYKKQYFSESNRLDLVGKKFGKLEVIEFVNMKRIGKQKRASTWKCKCSCGGEIVTRGSNLMRGHTTSCGCNKRLDLLGRKFGRLEVIDFVGMSKHNTSVWLCKCFCGNEHVVLGNSLMTGHTQSCGCYWKQRMIEVHRGKKGLRGENNGRWDPDRTHEQRAEERKLPENTIWRNEVFNRDNYTCQCCGDNTGGNLIGHHIESYTSNEDLRMDIDNGICLCKDCHIEFHGIYGYGDNTRIQLEEFLMGGTQNRKIYF